MPNSSKNQVVSISILGVLLPIILLFAVSILIDRYSNIRSGNDTPDTTTSYPTANNGNLNTTEEITYKGVNTGIYIKDPNSYQINLSSDVYCDTDENILSAYPKDNTEISTDEDYENINISIVNKDLAKEKFARYKTKIEKHLSNSTKYTKSPFAIYPFCGGAAYFYISPLSNISINGFKNVTSFLYLGGTQSVSSNITDENLTVMIFAESKENLIQLQLSFNATKFISEESQIVEQCTLDPNIRTSYPTTSPQITVLDDVCIANKLSKNTNTQTKISYYVNQRIRDIGFKSQ